MTTEKLIIPTIAYPEPSRNIIQPRYQTISVLKSIKIILKIYYGITVLLTIIGIFNYFYLYPLSEKVIRSRRRFIKFIRDNFIKCKLDFLNLNKLFSLYGGNKDLVSKDGEAFDLVCTVKEDQKTPLLINSWTQTNEKIKKVSFYDGDNDEDEDADDKNINDEQDTNEDNNKKDKSVKEFENLLNKLYNLENIANYYYNNYSAVPSFSYAVKDLLAFTDASILSHNNTSLIGQPFLKNESVTGDLDRVKNEIRQLKGKLLGADLVRV